MKINTLKLISVVLLLIFNITIVTGFVSQYLENDTFKILQGHDDKFRILLQNPDDEQKTFEVTVNSVDDIISIEGEKNTYVLPSKTDKEVFFVISPSKDSKIGDMFGINYKVKEVITKEKEIGEIISIGPSFTKSFTVLIVSQNPPEFSEKYTEITVYAGEMFEYVIDCYDLDGDELFYTLSNKKLNLNENIISFKPSFRGKIRTEITCSDGLDISYKELLIKVDDNRWYMQYWLQIPVLVIIIILAVKLNKKHKLKKQEEKEKSEQKTTENLEK